MNEIISSATAAANELAEKARLKAGQIVVIGCSTSEICGDTIGTNSKPEVAANVFAAIYEVFNSKGVFVAAQCCEHLNRAIIIEREFAEKWGLSEVNVVPRPKAGGSFATAAYSTFACPVAVEHISADAGLDIGGTLIGMHLKCVAVPIRLSVKSIGKAPLTAARVRPKFIGGPRANYDDNLM